MSSNYSLLLTLGHNSSALAVHTESGEVIGYEEERLSGIKSDSAFPIKAITEIGRNIPLEHVTTFHVSSWFNGFNLLSPNKYWDYDALRALCPNAKYVDTDMTHHDMHAWSCVAFTEQFAAIDDRWHVLVVDGFGSYEETLSLYAARCARGGCDLELIERVYGYEHSLGLMFQYAAEHQGMDGINDVYKYLGYRARANPNRLDYINACVRDFTHNFAPPHVDFNEMPYPIDVSRLMDVKQRRFMAAFDRYNFTREEMGWFLQQTLEERVLNAIRKHKITSLMAAGGCFYNVRLNGQLVKTLERLSVMPLAGDQGAAIGSYRKTAGPKSIHFGNLDWGVRRPCGEPLEKPMEGYYEFNDRNRFRKLLPEIARKLNAGEIVNVIRGDMEFGPRALCHTSTLAPPTRRHVETINTLNGRSTVMPMAPVMTYGASRRLFSRRDLTTVVGTDAYMVCAHAFQGGKGEDHAGAALRDGNAYTGRPQIVTAVSDPDLHSLLELVDYECLINTSLNLHGQPIIFTSEQARDLHRNWSMRATPEDVPFSTYYMF